MTRLKLADTPLAEWLAYAMASWVDPETRMPGLSQKGLSRFSGVSEAQLHEVLKRGHSPRYDTLNKLADFFDVNPLQLYRWAYLEEGSTDDTFWDAVFKAEKVLLGLPAEEREGAIRDMLYAAHKRKEVLGRGFEIDD